MAIWIKPSGDEIETVDTEETEKLAEKLGWKLKKKRGRPKNETTEEETVEEETVDE